MERIAIVGAGIGGLTTALALARRGIESVVFEQRTEQPDEGYGIQISPNAAAELHALGLTFETAARPVCREIRRWQDNSVIARTDLSRYDVPYYAMRRGALIEALQSAAVHFGRRCVSVTAEGLDFADGTVTRAETVIGADGLHSAVRGVVARDQPRPSGYVAARAIIRARAPERVVVWLGPGRHCVAYPVDRQGHVNLVVVMPATDLQSGFEGWHPAVRDLVARAGKLEPRPLYDRPPLPHWHRGRVALLGDAAHPMLPFLSQGACQAIEDATTLAHCIGSFTRYEELRRPRVTRVAELSAAGIGAYHLPDGDAQRNRDRAMAAAPPDSHDWLYGFRTPAG